MPEFMKNDNLWLLSGASQVEHGLSIRIPPHLFNITLKVRAHVVVFLLEVVSDEHVTLGAIVGTSDEANVLTLPICQRISNAQSVFPYVHHRPESFSIVEGKALTCTVWIVATMSVMHYASRPEFDIERSGSPCTIIEKDEKDKEDRPSAKYDFPYFHPLPDTTITRIYKSIRSDLH